MTAIELVAAALPSVEPPEYPVSDICCVTGVECMTIQRKHGIRPSFTNLDLLRAPASDRIGLDAWRVLSYTEENPGKQRALRPLQQRSWVCAGGRVEVLTRQEVRSYVLDGLGPAPWVGYATTSYKKHGVLLAPVNIGLRQVWLFETVVVDCSNRGEVTKYWARMRAAQDAGIHRPIIERLDISAGYLGKVGWRAWRDFEGWARPRMRSPLYRFVTYLLPSKEEMSDCPSLAQHAIG